jgi:hypothetical protein
LTAKANKTPAEILELSIATKRLEDILSLEYGVFSYMDLERQKLQTQIEVERNHLRSSTVKSQVEIATATAELDFISSKDGKEMLSIKYLKLYKSS